MTAQEVTEKIAALLVGARTLIREAEALADEHGTSFHWDLDYGMGGWYESGQWNSSSSNC